MKFLKTRFQISLFVLLASSLSLVLVMTFSDPGYSEGDLESLMEQPDPNNYQGKECDPQNPSSVNKCKSQSLRCSKSSMTVFTNPKLAEITAPMINEVLKEDADLKTAWEASEDYVSDAPYKTEKKTYVELIGMTCSAADYDCLVIQNEAVEQFIGWVENTKILPLRVIDRTNYEKGNAAKDKQRLCNSHAQCPSFNCEGRGGNITGASCDAICSNYHFETNVGEYQAALKLEWIKLKCVDLVVLHPLGSLSGGDQITIRAQLANPEEPKLECLALFDDYYSGSSYKHSDLQGWCSTYTSSTSTSDAKDSACNSIKSRISNGKFGVCRHVGRASYSCSCVTSGEILAEGEVCCGGLTVENGKCVGKIHVPPVPFIDYEIVCAKDGTTVGTEVCENGGEFKVLVDSGAKNFDNVKNVLGTIEEADFNFPMLERYLENTNYVLMTAEWLFSNQSYNGDCVGPHTMKHFGGGSSGTDNANIRLEKKEALDYAIKMDYARAAIRNNPDLIDPAKSKLTIKQIANQYGKGKDSFLETSNNEAKTLYAYINRDISQPLRDMRFFARKFYQKYLTEFKDDMSTILGALETCNSAENAGANCPTLTSEQVHSPKLLEAYTNGYFGVGVGELIAKAEQEKALMKYENAYLGYTFNEEGFPDLVMSGAKYTGKVAAVSNKDKGYYLQPLFGLSSLLAVDSDMNFEIDEDEIPTFAGIDADDQIEGKGFRYLGEGSDCKNGWISPKRCSDYRGDEGKDNTRKDNLMGVFHLNYHRYRQIRYEKDYTQDITNTDYDEDDHMDGQKILWWWDARDYEWKDKFDCAGRNHKTKAKNSWAERYKVKNAACSKNSAWRWLGTGALLLTAPAGGALSLAAAAGFAASFCALEDWLTDKPKYLDPPRGNIKSFYNPDAGIRRRKTLTMDSWLNYLMEPNCAGGYFVPPLKEQRSDKCDYDNSVYVEQLDDKGQVTKLVKLNEAEGDHYATNLFFLGGYVGPDEGQIMKASLKEKEESEEVRTALRDYLNFMIVQAAKDFIYYYSYKIDKEEHTADHKLPVKHDRKGQFFKTIQSAVVELQYFFLQMQRARIGRINHYLREAQKLLEGLEGAGDGINGYDLDLSDANKYEMENSGSTDYNGNANINTNRNGSGNRKSVRLPTWSPGSFTVGGATTGDGTGSTTGSSSYTELATTAINDNLASLRRFKKAAQKERDEAVKLGAKEDSFTHLKSAMNNFPSAAALRKATSQGLAGMKGLMSSESTGSDSKSSTKNQSYAGGGKSSSYNFSSNLGRGKKSSYGSKSSSSSDYSSSGSDYSGMSESERSDVLDNIGDKKYASGAGDSIWVQVTNAYFRSYNRVLTRKNGKPVEKVYKEEDKKAEGRNLMNSFDISE